MTSEDRRAQIVEATLELLGELPLAELSTRSIARRVGVSQPALFRHFRSRDEIVLAAIDQVRDHLAAQAAAVLDRGDPPLVAVQALVEALFETAHRHPGLPRLLFQDLGAQAGSPFRPPLAHLTEMQAALLATLAARAAAAGALPADLDADRAGRLLQAWVQGLLLQARLSGRPLQPTRDAAELVAVWTAGLREAGPRGAAPAAPQVEVGDGRQVALDLRPILGRGVDPLAHVLAAVDGLAAGGLLTLTVPFRPAPLLALLRSKGLQVDDHQEPGGPWTVQVRRPA